MIFPKVALLVVSVTSVLCSSDVEVKTEEDLGVKYANRCEVCKVLAMELQTRLEETGKVHDVIEIGYSLDDVKPKKKTKYQKSELRLIESIEGVCDRILEYNIHKERQDSTRFAKGMSQTFKTLHGLVDKGVKVDLGIPYELWDKPSAEITHMKTQCESLLEDNEEAIEYWYWNLQGTKDLKLHLCRDHALKNTDKSCLFEEQSLKGDNGGSIESGKNNNLELKDDLAQLNDKDNKDNSEQDNHSNDNGDDRQHNIDNPAVKKKLRNTNIEEGLSNTPNQEKFDNSHLRGEHGDNYWTEPTEYVKKQLQKEEKLGINIPLKSEDIWNLKKEEL